MQSHGYNEADPPDPNLKLIAVYGASSHQLEVKSGKDAMGLLLARCETWSLMNYVHY